MKYAVKSASFNFGGTLSECLDFLKNINVEQAIKLHKSLLDLLMMGMDFKDSITAQDEIGREIVITRIN